jgi:hypothetical protein
MTVVLTLPPPPRFTPPSADSFAKGSKIVAERFCELYRRLFLQQFTSAVISQSALLVYPTLSNKDTFAKKFLSCFIIRETEGGFEYAPSDELLRRALIPVELVQKLEYGDPIGIPSLGAWRLTFQELQSDDELTRELLSLTSPELAT